METLFFVGPVVLLVVSGILLFLLMNKQSAIDELLIANSGLADENDKLSDFLVAIQRRAQIMLDELNVIDSRGSFKSDDEVGFFFIELQAIINDFNSLLGNIDQSQIPDVESQFNELLERKIEKDKEKELEMIDEFNKKFRSKSKTGAVVSNAD